MITKFQHLNFSFNVFMSLWGEIVNFYCDSHWFKLKLRRVFIKSRVKSSWFWFLHYFKMSLIHMSIWTFTNQITHHVVFYWIGSKNFSFFNFLDTWFLLQLNFSVTLNKSFSILNSSRLEISSYLWLLISVTFRSFVLNYVC